MPASKPAFVVFAMILIGCTNESMSRGRNLPAYVQSGFVKSYPGLFIDKDRTYLLSEALGYKGEAFLFDVDRSSDGTILRCWNINRSEAIVFSTQDYAKVIRTKPSTFLNDANQVVAVYGPQGVEFADGNKLESAEPSARARGFRVDHSGSYFAAGGSYFVDGDYESFRERIREEPITIRRISRPLVALATSKLHGVLEKLFVTKDRLFLVVSSGDDSASCEEYSFVGEALRLERTFVISHVSRGILSVQDMDDNGRVMLLKVHRDLIGPKWFLYDVHSGKTTAVAWGEGYCGFLDPHVFSKAFEKMQDCSDHLAKEE